MPDELFRVLVNHNVDTPAFQLVSGAQVPKGYSQGSLAGRGAFWFDPSHVRGDMTRVTPMRGAVGRAEPMRHAIKPTNPLQRPEPGAPDPLGAVPRVGIHELFGKDHSEPNPHAPFDVKAMLLTVNVILLEDIDTGSRCVIYGLAALAEVAASKQGAPVSMLIVQLDQDTEELEMLLALVQTLRGWHEYPN